MTLRTSRSAANSRVSLVTTDAKPDIGSEEPEAPRRSTRSSARLNLQRYAYTAPESASPRKRARLAKAEPDAGVRAENGVKSDDDPLTELESEEELKAVKGEAGPSTPRKAQSKSKSGTPKMPMAKREKAHPAPAKWYEQYQLIERMRAGIEAPVDTMGCERPRTMAELDAKTLRFHVLVSLMLSSQTKDAVTSQAVTNLHAALPGGLTASSLAAADSSTVSEAIAKVGFWRRKTEYIQDAARVLLEKYDGDVPQTIEELCTLKGVGPKMGFLALQAAWDINAGIGVDVHVHRITNRLKWHKPATKTPEETRVNLESWLPAPLHRPINPLLVGFGQVICLPVGPRCDVCLLAKEKLCPSRVKVDASKRKEIVYNFDTGSPAVEIAYEETETKVEPGPEVGEEIVTETKREIHVDAETGEEEIREEVKVEDRIDGKVVGEETGTELRRVKAEDAATKAELENVKD